MNQGVNGVNGPCLLISALIIGGRRMTTAPFRIRTFNDLLVWKQAMDLEDAFPLPLDPFAPKSGNRKEIL
jgi:hypothetical protein